MQNLLPIYLQVPYDERDVARQLGAKFDGVVRKWCAPSGKERALIGRYGDAGSLRQAELAVRQLTRRLLAHSRYPVCEPSAGFLDGDLMYPGYAFIVDGGRGAG